jgi:S1-C subfamily serine protease
VPHLIEHGRVVRPEIGIQRVFVVEKGLRIEQVTPGGPAERAELHGPRVTRQRRGPFVIDRVDRATADVIVEVDGQAVATGDDLLGYIESKKPGDTIELTVMREGRRIKVPVVLGSGEVNARRKPDAK